jgi:Flp pilus assembly protein TadG
MTTLIARIRSGFRAFRTAERGNVAVTFTLALIPIMGFLGAAVDFSRANAIKAGMQQAVDATALMCISRNSI